MLQQTQVITVIPYYLRWLARFPTFPSLAAAKEADVLHAWQGLGYYARARNLHKAAQYVVANFSGKLTCGLDAGLLPGVGEYTCGAIASFAFDEPAAAVDANIARVLARLMNLRDPIDTAAGKARLRVFATLLLPAGSGGRLHNSSLMELGALVCIARAPKCGICPVQAYCAAGDPGSLPVKRPRPKTVRAIEDCAWIVRNDKVVLELQRERRLGGLWKLPPLKGAPSGLPILETKYTFTHHRVTLRVHRQAAPNRLDLNQSWFNRSKRSAVAMPSPHRRAMEELAARSFAKPATMTV